MSSLAARVAPARRDGQAMVCVIVADGQSFAICASAVSEVVGNPTVVPVPLGPPLLAGMLNHRGSMLAAISLRSVLGFSPSVGKGCVLVMCAGSQTEDSYGLLVDEVAGVLTVDEASLQPVPATVMDHAQELFRGMYVREQGALVELNPERLRPERFVAKDDGDC